MISTLIALFVVGYLAIALEHPLRVDKTATALLLGMLLWILYALGAEFIVPLVEGESLKAYVAAHPSLANAGLHMQALDYVINVKIVETLGDVTQTLFFLIGAMTIVELVDIHGGFTVITNKISTRNKRTLLWVLCAVTFIFSAVLDNMTTTIVMVLLLRKIIEDKHERWLYAGMIVIAANTGGAWSPIGDVTTIMLWVKGNVTAMALVERVLLPSVVAVVVPALIIMRNLRGQIPAMSTPVADQTHGMSAKERTLILVLGVAGLLFVPVFKSITHLPPFVGMLFVLGALWLYTETFYNGKKIERIKQHRLPQVIARIDMPSILFFLGILMAVAVLDAAGILEATATWLDANVHDVYAINVFLGVLSSIFDNVPLVAGVMGMYPLEDAGAVGYAANFVQDGVFWEFLSYCAGVGGSLLIIGSAAGVIAMGLEKINFGWYLKKFTIPALLGYLAGAAVYIAEVTLL
ncbi:MAG: sodium:proton antiporter NhaD [Candidatus Amulumruptor caecigallinarius]|nr:sodium:proton antiporter NhaD [Candidatus Amulumruptor caecigallinarius]